MSSSKTSAKIAIETFLKKIDLRKSSDARMIAVELIAAVLMQAVPTTKDRIAVLHAVAALTDVSLTSDTYHEMLAFMTSWVRENEHLLCCAERAGESMRHAPAYAQFSDYEALANALDLACQRMRATIKNTPWKGA